MSDKKKHRKKRPLSEEEKKRRTELRDERVRRKKHKKRISYLEILVAFLLALTLIFVAFILGFQVGSYTVKIYIAVVLIIFALLSDRSGIRTFLFRKYPDKFLFSNFLKKETPNRSFFMELARTFFYISFALFLSEAPFCKIWVLIMMITIAIGFFYVITDIDNCYTFDKFSKGSDTTMFLLVSGLFGMASESEYSFHATMPPILIGTSVLFVLYLIFARNPHKVKLAFEMLIFVPLSIMFVCFLFSCL